MGRELSPPPASSLHLPDEEPQTIISTSVPFWSPTLDHSCLLPSISVKHSKSLSHAHTHTCTSLIYSFLVLSQANSSTSSTFTFISGSTIFPVFQFGFFTPTYPISSLFHWLSKAFQTLCPVSSCNLLQSLRELYKLYNVTQM